MQMEDLSKKRSDDDIYDIFHKEIKKTRLADADYLFIIILYLPKGSMQQQTEKRCMFYKFKDRKSETFKALLYDKLDSSLNGHAIRATKHKILISDQEDMYGAIIKHANETEDKEMYVYLTDNTQRPYTSDSSFGILSSMHP